ncbi:MAG: hypothetical protein F9K38_15300 [Pseudorhodoplanes sp.]|nr:MAG: hypothetical protein F9K38_15300 [Pseudorhodoplanes sp.]
MTLPFVEHFNARLPDVPVAVRITSLQDAQVFMRRWVIRDKDRALKALLRRMERINSSQTASTALRDFKSALMARGLFPGDGAQ